MSNPSPLRRLWVLFRSMLVISAFTFGGGFVIVSLMKKRFVDELGWLEEEEVLDMIALAQTCPGPIAVNCAVLVGWRVAGSAGMLSAVLGTVLPPMVVLGLVSLAYDRFAGNRYAALALRGMQAGVAAILADVALGLVGKVLRAGDGLRIALMAAAFVAVAFFRVNAVWILLAAALAGTIAALRRKGGGAT